MQCLGAVYGVAESDLDGEEINTMQKTCQCRRLEILNLLFNVRPLLKEDHTQMLGVEASGISSSMKEPMLSSGDAEYCVQCSVAVKDDCTGLLAGMPLELVRQQKSQSFCLLMLNLLFKGQRQQLKMIKLKCLVEMFLVLS